MEKKIEVEIDGKKYRIMPHLLEDAAMFGASTVKRVTKEPPKELIKESLKATEAPVKKVLPPILKVDPLTENEPKEVVKKPVRKKKV